MVFGSVQPALKVKRIFGIALFLIFPVCLIAVFGFDGCYGQDSYAYLKYAKHILSIDTVYFWPPFYPLLGFLFSLTGLSIERSLQFISLCAWSGSAILLYIKTLRRQVSTVNAALLPVFYLFTPFVFRSSVLVMSDALAVFLLLAVLHCIQQFHNPRNLIALTWLTSLSFLTRYPIIILWVPVLLGQWKLMLSSLRNRYFLISAFLSLSVVFLYLIFLSSSDGSYGHYWLKNWTWSNLFRHTFSHAEGNLNYSLPNLIYVMRIFWHPGFFCSAALLFWLDKDSIRNSYSVSLPVALFIYLIFIAGIPMQNDRFLLPAFALWVWWLAGVLRIPSFSNQKGLALACLFMLPGILLGYRSLRPMIHRNHLEKQIAAELCKMQASSWYGFDLDIAVSARCPYLQFHNLWERVYPSYPSGALILVQPENIRKVWKGKTPALNFSKALAMGAEPVKHFPEGWILFRIP